MPDATSAQALNMKNKHHGFTLIELMVVITIISILMTLTLMLISTVRERASRVECLNNMRQIGMGEQSYAIDNRGNLIPRGQGHEESPNRLDQFTGIGIATITDYIPARAWFCPQWYPQMGHSGTELVQPGKKATPAQRQTWMEAAYFGYGFLRAAYEADRPVGQRWIAAQPGSSMKNTPGQPFGTGSERRIADLLPKAARITEVYTRVGDTQGSNLQYDSKGQACSLGWWHLGQNGKPKGGNIIRGDLGGGWAEGSGNMYDIGKVTYIYSAGE